jgi:hypothetical protein
MQPSPQPSPGGRGGRPRCLALYIDLRNRVDYGFATKSSDRSISIMDFVQRVQVAVFRSWIRYSSFRSQSFDHGFGTARSGRSISIMDSVQLFQVAVFPEKPTVSPLSLWERVRVRATAGSGLRSQILRNNALQHIAHLLNHLQITDPCSRKYRSKNTLNTRRDDSGPVRSIAPLQMHPAPR